MNLHALAAQALNAYRFGPRDLRIAAAQSLWDNELRTRWEQFKAAAKAAGYEKIHVGACRHSSVLRQDNMIFAEPKKKIGNWPALWALTEYLGGHSCANGLSEADQAQLKLPGEALIILQGEHLL